MRKFLTTAILIFFSCFVYAGSNEVELEKNTKFNPTEKVLHHIQDAHDWHLWGDVSIPLPIIFYIEGELDILDKFSSRLSLTDTLPIFGSIVQKG